jgi:hypothetical protein
MNYSKIFSLYSKLEKRKNNILDRIKILDDIINNKIYCVREVGRGSFGKILINKIPNRVKINVSDLNGKIGTIDMESIAVKVGHNEENSYYKYHLLQFKGSKLIKKREITSENIDTLLRKISKKYRYVIQVTIYNMIVGEGLSALLVSSLFTNGISPHFPICFGFSNCEAETVILFENLSINVCIENCQTPTFISNFMDHQEFFKSRNIEITEGLIDYCILSILHSLFVLQYNFKLIHLDVFFRNIFIKDLREEKQYFRGIDMSKIEYLEYIIPDSKGKEFSLFMPFQKYKFILKLGDFGISVMESSNTIIINELDGVLSKKNIIDKYYPSYPSDYKRHFPDYFYILRDFLREFGGISDTLIDLNRKVPEVSTKSYSQYIMLKGIDLTKTLNSNEILEMEMFNKYRKIPVNYEVLLREKKIMKIYYKFMDK